MADALVGKNSKFALGANKVSLMGQWSMSGVSVDLLDNSEFGDDYKQFLIGQKDGGEISISGFYDSTDSNGQEALIAANLADTQLTDVRCYIDGTSYWIPKTSSPASYCLVTAWNVEASLTGLVTASLTLKISGAMELLGA